MAATIFAPAAKTIHAHQQRPQTSTTTPSSPEKEEQPRRHPQASMKP